MKFIQNVLATVVGLFLFFMILFFGLILIGTVFGGSSKKVAVKSNSVIELDLSKVSNDYAGQYFIKDFDYTQINNDGFVDVLRALKNAETDDKIKGITLVNSTSGLGLAQLTELRQSLEEFKTTGKFVVSYADVIAQRDYYVASVADTIYLNPVGQFDFRGLGTEILFFKDLQDKSGIKMEVIRHGKYKSAVEPYLQNTISEANKEQNLTLLNSVWSTIVTDISKSRKISVDSLNSFAENLSAQYPNQALSKKLIDKVDYEDVFHAGVKKALGIDKTKEYNKIDILDYADEVANTIDGTSSSNKIALIFAQGTIMSGEGDVSYIGEGSIRRALEKARNDDKVKSVVLRVDSPGGSALTSDLIWREIELTKKVKPVVVSMGNLAASGGYYISCNASKIFAENNTITGSIGVFGTIPNVSELAGKMGVNAEQVQTHKHGVQYSLFEPMTDEFRNEMLQSIEHIYDVFLTRVATGRNMSKEQVNEIAQGRVWTGSDAKRLGLVDEIGNLDDAINEAAKLAKIDDYKTVDYPRYETKFDNILGKMFGISMFKSQDEIIKEYVGEEAFEMLDQVKTAKKMKGIQAILPYKLIIK